MSENSELIAEIRARADAATEGPWGLPNTALTIVSNATGPIMWADREYATREDAEFIAHAREDIPALLDALEVAEATITKLRKGIS